MSHSTRFFLAANSPRGFVSFFDELYNPYTDRQPYIIKGGPGTGKSTLMKKIASALSASGKSTEEIYCSSDPKSLDGLICPDISFAIGDGTSPHVLEPKFPGAAENIINLGQFWDENILRENKDAIISLTLENSLYHRRSTACLSAAGKLINQNRAAVSDFVNEEKISSFVTRFTMRELGKRSVSAPGRRIRRFLSAVTHEGIVFFGDTVTSLASRIIGISDSCGELSSRLTERIGEAAITRGFDVIFCPSPLYPDTAEHIIIPEKHLALVTLSKEIPCGAMCDRVIHCERFLKKDMNESRQLMRLNSRLSRELIAACVGYLKKAKDTHDLLENEYARAMDYNALTEYTENFVNKLGI